MKTKKHFIKSVIYTMMKIIYFNLICLLLISCQEQEISESNTNKKGKIIAINMTLESGIPSEVLLKNQTAGEININEIQVLVFENGFYKYKANGSNIVNTGSNTTFTVYLTSTNYPVTLYFLSNAGSIISTYGPQVGETMSVVKNKLIANFTASGITNNFPMFGVYSSSIGLDTKTTTIGSISMLRHIARIDVDASAVTSNFTLKSVQAFRVNNLVQLIPNTMISNTSVTSPSIPSASLANVNTTVITTTGSSSKSQLYLPESTAPAINDQTAKATCVIIGGYYNGSSTMTYYRLDFNPGTSGNPFGQILRNYLYQFNITNISLPGFPTALEAASSYSSGISAQVRDWDLTNTNLNIDGDRYLNLASRIITVKKAANSISNIAIDTNVSSYTIEWSNASGTSLGNAGTSLNDGTFSIQQTNNGSNIQITALTTNNTAANITRYVLIKANRMQILLTINQSIFNITPSTITISASGGIGYSLVNSTSSWIGISDQSWLTNSTVSDSLKWTAQQNPSTSSRTGSFLLTNYNGEQLTVPFQQNGQNTTVLNVYSLRSGYAYLGATSSVSTADGRAQGLKGIITNSADFGPAGSVNLGGFNFTESTTNPHTLNAAALANINILYMTLPGGVSEVSAAGAAAAVTWLNGDSKRVMIVSFDIATNTNLFTALGVTGINYYAINANPGYPLQYNSNTTYFTSAGPFTSYPYSSIPTGFSFRRYDGYFGEMSSAANPNVTPILIGPYGGILLGIDKTRRIVYTGESDIFTNGGGGNNPTTDNYIQNNTGLINSNASKLIANLWAWVTQTALGSMP